MRRLLPAYALVCSATALLAWENVEINNGWRFREAGSTEKTWARTNIRTAELVNLPHCWGWQEAQFTNKYFRGTGWYSRDLNLRPQPDKRYFLRFEAASTVADVFVNDQRLGQHRGGFGAFCFEITTNLNASGTNLLAVRVSNAPQPDIAPLSGDFCVFGGLYRPAQLLVADLVCFTPLDHGSSGISWLQTAVNKEKAVLEVTAQVSNGGRRPVERTLTVKLVDARGKVAASADCAIRIDPGLTPPFRLHLSVPHPHLWNGRADPYLYRAVAEL